MNYSILILGIAFIIFLIARILIIYFRNNKKLKKRKFLAYGEVTDILMDSALFMAGVIALALGLDLEVTLMGKDIAYTQPFINYIAGALLMITAIRHLFKKKEAE